VKHGTVRKLPPIGRQADDRVLLLQVVDYYHESLRQSPEAMKYLESRSLKSSEMIDSLIAEYELSNQHYGQGWRWSGSRFCELPSQQNKPESASQEITG
jgi:hypothetical protein